MQDWQVAQHQHHPEDSRVSETSEWLTVWVINTESVLQPLPESYWRCGSKRNRWVSRNQQQPRKTLVRRVGIQPACQLLKFAVASPIINSPAVATKHLPIQLLAVLLLWLVDSIRISTTWFKNGRYCSPRSLGLCFQHSQSNSSGVCLSNAETVSLSICDK